MIATSTSASGITDRTRWGETDAATSTNSTPIRSWTSVSSNSNSERLTSMLRWFATTIPSSTAASSPVSSRIRSAATTTATTTISVAGTLIRGEVRWTARSRSHSTGAATTATSAPTARSSSIEPGRQPFPEPTATKTTTPRRAPIGSTSVPSHFRSARTGPIGRMKASSGSTTVGPDTTRMAPTRNAAPRSIVPYSRATVAVTRSQVRAAPPTTRRATTPRTARGTSSSEGRSPASNRITPTAIDTNGW